MWTYYTDAVVRSWHAAWNWASGQGILLTFLFALAVFVAATAFAVFGTTSWSAAMSEIREATKRFLGAVLGIPLIVMLALFVIFFVQDAPTQIARLVSVAKLVGL